MPNSFSVKKRIQKKKIVFALTRFQAAQRIDSTYAKNSFYLGDIFYNKHDFDKASHYFEQANDLDALRFRAPSEINNIIKSFLYKIQEYSFG